MAKIELKVINRNRKSSPDQQKAEQHLKVTATQSGAEYEFVLKRHHLEVKQLKTIGGKESNDWFSTLTDEEKTQVFALVMDEYRDRSLGDNGFRGASIGVVSKQDNGQSRIFIGTNTQRGASPYFKDCAEQNMVNAATDTMAFEQISEAMQNGKPQPKPEELKPAKLKAVYIMQGIDRTANKPGIPMACACGKCTDMLANTMESEERMVTTIPLLTDHLRSQLQTGAATITLNNSASVLADIKDPNAGDTIKSWHVPLSHINRHRTISLNEETAAAQKDGYKSLIHEASSAQNLPENQAKKNLKQLANGASSDNLLTRLGKRLEQFLKPMGEALGFSFFPAAAQAAQNVVLHRHSEAELDGAVKADGTIDLTKINQFMVTQIQDAVADRLHSLEETAKMSEQQKGAWIKENINYVRCAAIQLDDGTFHYALQAEGKLDNAMPNAEVAALENAVSALGRYGVRHAWVMEMNPADILAGKIMGTSPKEGLERLSKRQSKDGLDLTYLPFNNGGAEAINQLAPKAFSIDEVYPAGHRGHRALADKDKPKARSAPEIWSRRDLFLPQDAAARG